MKESMMRRVGLSLLILSTGSIRGEGPEATEGRMITIRGNIDSALVQRTITAIRDATSANSEVLIFDLQSAESDFGACYDLASALAQVGGSVRRTVAYVSKPLVGNAVLAALACDEIVFAPSATLGNVTASKELRARERDIFESIAVEKGHGQWIALGLTNRDVRLYEVETANGKSIKTSDELAEFEKNARILNKSVVKEAGQDWVINAEQAVELGLARLIRESRKEVALAYGLSEQVAADDATFKEAIQPCVIRLEGVVNQRMLAGFQRRLKDAERRGSTMIFVEIDSSGGEIVAASGIMNMLDSYPGYKVAWVPRQATGPAILIAFGCDEMVVGPDVHLGELNSEEMAEDAAGVADAAVEAARGGKFPEALIRGLIDRQTTVYEVRNKENRSIRAFRTKEQLEREDEKVWEQQRLVKESGTVFGISGGEQAKAIDLAVAIADNQATLLAGYGVQGPVPILQPNWVDGLVDGLTTPGATVFLLVVGMTCLYIEFQMPGFGIAGMLSGICFVLFFWARFLSETANSLEVVMFVLGLVLLALELFVIPGFGIAGISGVFLILASLVLASQSFPWPTNSSETRILMGNVGQIGASLVVFVALVATLARFFPSLPYVSRMILPPPDEIVDTRDFEEDFADEPAAPHQLVGAVGVAASALRPAGRMSIDGRFLDVITSGEFIEQGRAIEVVEFSKHRILVRASGNLS